MKERLKMFVKNDRRRAAAVILVLSLALAFSLPKVLSFLGQGEKKMFWGTFLIGFAIIMLIVNSKKKEELPSNVEAEDSPPPISHQQLLDKADRCLWELRKQQIWAYSCLIIGWLVVLAGRWSGHPQYSHYAFAIPVFTLALLAATRSWEKVHDLDVDVTKYTVEGILQEKKQPNLKSRRFRSFADSYVGIGMWIFAFIRVSPILMIIFSLLNSGGYPLLVHHFGISSMVVNCTFGWIIAGLFFLFGRSTCRPYYWMLDKLKIT